jgi:hypothetical protein
MSDPEAKRTMFRIVSDYERLAMLNCGRERNHPRHDDAAEQRGRTGAVSIDRCT